MPCSLVAALLCKWLWRAPLRIFAVQRFLCRALSLLFAVYESLPCVLRSSAWQRCLCRALGARHRPPHGKGGQRRTATKPRTAASFFPVVSRPKTMMMEEAAVTIGSTETMVTERKRKLSGTDGMSPTKVLSCALCMFNRYWVSFYFAVSSVIR